MPVITSGTRVNQSDLLRDDDPAAARMQQVMAQRQQIAQAMNPGQRSAELQDMLRQQDQAQAQQYADQRWQQHRQQLGRAGAFGLMRMIGQDLMGSGDKRKAEFVDQEMQRLARERRLGDLQAQRKRTGEAGKMAFENMFKRDERIAGQEYDTAERIAGQEYQTEAARIKAEAAESEFQREQDMKFADMFNQNEQKELDRAANAALQEDRQEFDIENEANKRFYDKFIETDTQANILNNRLKELQAAVPLLAKMAGEKLPGQDSEDPESWNAFDRWTGGTGPIASRLFSFSADTQGVRKLASSQALKTLSELDTPLTPVSDKDMETVMATGISEKNTEAFNYKIAMEAIAALKEELGLRAEQAQKLQSQMGGTPRIRKITKVN
jgi:hypothetical protein